MLDINYCVGGGVSGERKCVELLDLAHTGGDSFRVDRDCVVCTRDQGAVCTVPW